MLQHGRRGARAAARKRVDGAARSEAPGVEDGPVPRPAPFAAESRSRFGEPAQPPLFGVHAARVRKKALTADARAIKLAHKVCTRTCLDTASLPALLCLAHYSFLVQAEQRSSSVAEAVRHKRAVQRLGAAVDDGVRAMLPPTAPSSSTPRADEAIVHMPRTQHDTPPGTQPSDDDSTQMGTPVAPIDARITALRAATANTATAERHMLNRFGLPASQWHYRGGDLGSDALELIARHFEPTAAQRARAQACRRAAEEKRVFRQMAWVLTQWGPSPAFPEPATPLNGLRPTVVQSARAVACRRAALERREANELSKRRAVREGARRAALAGLAFSWDSNPFLFATASASDTPRQND